jgi:hypothetical protein
MGGIVMMTCERAQEWISEFLEGSLDGATALAVEGHIARCAACAREVEELRATWSELDAVPMAEPPADLLARVVADLRHASRPQPAPAAAEASRAPSPPAWLVWLQSLSPARVAVASSLATLIIVGAVLYPNVPGIKLGPNPPRPLDGPGHVDPRPAPVVPIVALTVEYGPAGAAADSVSVVLRSTRTLAEADLTITPAADQPQRFACTLAADEPISVPIRLSEGPEVTQTLVVHLRSRDGSFDQTFHAIVPLRPGASDGGAVTATFIETPLLDAARQLAARLGKPVVVEAAHEAQVIRSAHLTDRSASEAWDAILRPLGLRAMQDGATYRVVERR